MARNGELLARIDERVTLLHEHVQNEVRPMLKELVKMSESVKWLKLGVVGIYSGLGIFILQQVVAAYISK